ncbi:MAG: hypothetical protein LIV24_04355 [Eubacterium sp.]|nr:hypothetical protein [Eubacterium sp.]
MIQKYKNKLWLLLILVYLTAAFLLVLLFNLNDRYADARSVSRILNLSLQMAWNQSEGKPPLNQSASNEESGVGSVSYGAAAANGGATDGIEAGKNASGDSAVKEVVSSDSSIKDVMADDSAENDIAGVYILSRDSNGNLSVKSRRAKSRKPMLSFFRSHRASCAPRKPAVPGLTISLKLSRRISRF